jgi:hypothetical protein
VKSGVRFNPPLVELGVEIRWVLGRAFGPAEVASCEGEDLDPDRVFDVAERLGLVARIGVKTPKEALETALGPESAVRFLDEYTANAALSLVVDQVSSEVAGLAHELGIPIIFLKGAALQLDSRVPAVARPMCDVDALVPAGEARRLQEILIAAGCKKYEAAESEHQLQHLTHRTGLGIEVHRLIPGVRLRGGESVTAAELLQNGLCRPLSDLAGSFVPDDQVVLAHLLVHGIAQHGFAPDLYPFSRMLTDVQDLRIDDTVWGTFLGRGFRWIDKEVSEAEANGSRDLVERLGAGEDPGVLAGGDGAPGVLLRHLVAGVFDEGYRRAMKFQSLTAKPGGTVGFRSLITTVRRAIWPTKAQIDILYGRPRSELGYWGWHLWRPFDLVGRAMRYGVAAVRHRVRSGRKN